MRTFTVFVMAALMGITAAVPAQAQSERERAAARREEVERPRVRVTPNQRLVRQCEDWYEVERRATGPTVVPAYRCWWTYR